MKTFVYKMLYTIAEKRKENFNKQISNGMTEITLALSETLNVIHCVDDVEMLVFLRVENSQRFVEVILVVLHIELSVRLQVLRRLEQNHVLAVNELMNSNLQQGEPSTHR